MKKFSIALVATLLASSAFAADLTPKYKAVPFADPCTIASASTPLSCSGFYIGGGLAGQGSNANIIGNGLTGSVFAGGMTPTVVGGYLYAKGNAIFGAQLGVGYSVGTNATTTTAAGSIAGGAFNGFRITEDFQAGGNLSALLGTQVPITIPPSIANSVIGPYVHVGTTQWALPGSWANGVVSGAGVFFDIGPRLFGDLRYTYTNFAAARAGGLTINDDNSLMVTINYKLN